MAKSRSGVQLCSAACSPFAKGPGHPLSVGALWCVFFCLRILSACACIHHLLVEHRAFGCDSVVQTGSRLGFFGLVLCGVVRYAPRKVSNPSFHGLCSARAVRMNLLMVLINLPTSPFASDHSGVILRCLIPYCSLNALKF